jgi:hypothetical protein
MPDYSIRVNVPLVNVDVLVTTKSGQFVPGLKKDNFRLFEDGSAKQIHQQLQRFASAHHRRAAGRVRVYQLCFMIQALQASYAFANTSPKRRLGRGRLL